MEFPILSLMLAVPLVGAIACLFLGAQSARMVALVATLANLLWPTVLLILLGREAGNARLVRLLAGVLMVVVGFLIQAAGSRAGAV